MDHLLSYIQWNLSYPALMGPSYGRISETAGYVKPLNELVINTYRYTCTCIQIYIVCLYSNLQLCLLMHIDFTKITESEQEKNPISIASTLRSA